MKNFKESLKVNVNEREVLERRNQEEAKELLGFYLGSVLHEDWKKDDEIAYEVASDEKKAKNWEKTPDGILHKYKSVDGEIDGKKFVDTTFVLDENNPAHKKEERKVDIRGLKFEELPIVWQKENADAGKAAMDLVFERMMSGKEMTPEIIEELSSKVHDAWLSRPNNAWAIEYQSEESKPYAELSEEVKQKDRRHIELAMDVVNRYKAKDLTLDDLKKTVGPAKQKFDSQIKSIEETQK